MKVLAIGDVCGLPGVDFLCAELPALRRELGADLTVVNGENATGRGISPELADSIFYADADVITLGNHAFHNRKIFDYLDERAHIIRPGNLPSQLPGVGHTVLECGGRRVCVANLMGRLNMDFRLSDPFAAADRLLREQDADVYIFDFHAEATSEKNAFGYFLAGRASAVFGTHTHVQTADERVLRGYTGYITDLGMTGGADSVIGVIPEHSVEYFRGAQTLRFESSESDLCICGALFELDARGACLSVTRIRHDKN